MIPNTHPYEALFRHEAKKEGAKPWFEKKPVLAWDDDGDAMVAGKWGLILARNDPDFIGIGEADGKIIAVIPGGGYVAQYKDDEEGPLPDEPVLAWTINESGDAYPLTVDYDGFADDPTNVSNFKCVIHSSRMKPPKEKELATILGDCCLNQPTVTPEHG